MQGASSTKDILWIRRPGTSLEFWRSRTSRDGGWLGTKDLHEAHVRGDGPNHQRCRRDGFHGSDRDVLPNGRGKDKIRPSSLAVDQGAIRDKVVRLEKVKGSENEADMGTKDLDGPTHQRLLQKLPLKPIQYRRLLAACSGVHCVGRLVNTTLQERTVERDIQTEHKLVNSIVILTMFSG